MVFVDSFFNLNGWQTVCWFFIIRWGKQIAFLTNNVKLWNKDLFFLFRQFNPAFFPPPITLKLTREGKKKLGGDKVGETIQLKKTWRPFPHDHNRFQHETFKKVVFFFFSSKWRQNGVRIYPSVRQLTMHSRYLIYLLIQKSANKFYMDINPSVIWHTRIREYDDSP